MPIDGNKLLRAIVDEHTVDEPLRSYIRVYAYVSSRIADAWSRGLLRVVVKLTDANIAPIDEQFLWEECISYIRRKLLKRIPKGLVKVRKLGGRDLSIDWSKCASRATDDATRAVYVEPAEALEVAQGSSRDAVTKFDDRTGTMQIFCGP